MEILHANFFYLIHKMSLINLKQTFYNTRRGSNREIPITRTIKSSLSFSQLRSKLLSKHRCILKIAIT